MRSIIEFLVKYRRQIVGWAVIGATILALWMFREHLSGLASTLWPIVVGSTILGFRQELGDLLKRMKRLGKEGMEFGDVQIAAQIMSVPVSDALKDVAPGETHSELIMTRVASLRQELNARQPSDIPNREHLLMLRLAEAQQSRDFQNIWLNILSSQLAALTKMASENKPVDLTEFFETYKERVESLPTPPAVKISFEAWSGYFIRMQLATIVGTLGTITLSGREFLSFWIRNNLPRFQAF
jgi:hypothetical protein